MSVFLYLHHFLGEYSDVIFKKEPAYIPKNPDSSATPDSIVILAILKDKGWELQYLKLCPILVFQCLSQRGKQLSAFEINVDVT